MHKKTAKLKSSNNWCAEVKIEYIFLFCNYKHQNGIQNIDS